MKSLTLHRSKRWWMIVGVGCLLILGLVSYGIYSAVSWQTYAQHTVSWQKSTKQVLGKTLSLPSGSEAERSRKLEVLKDTSSRFRKDVSDACTPARLTGWQLVFSGPKTEREECGLYAQKVDRLTSQLDVVTGYMEDEAKVIAALQPAIASPQAVSEKDWDQTASVWSTTLAAINQLTLSSAFAPTKEQINTVTSDISTVWKEVIAAHAKKDKASFVAATAKLQKSYEGIASISAVNTAQLSKMTTQLQSLVDKL